MQLQAILRLLTLIATLSGLAGASYMLWQYTRATSSVKVAQVELGVAQEALKTTTKAHVVSDAVVVTRDKQVTSIRTDREAARKEESITKEVHNDWSSVPLPVSVRCGLYRAWGLQCPDGSSTSVSP